MQINVPVHVIVSLVAEEEAKIQTNFMHLVPLDSCTCMF